MEELPVRNDQLSSRLPAVPGGSAILSQYSREGGLQDGTDVPTSVFIDTHDRALFGRECATTAAATWSMKAKVGWMG